MIRPITPSDSEALIAMVIATGMFPEDEAETLEKMFADYFGGKREEGHGCVVDDENGLRGVAYYAPEMMTDGTWNLLMLAVRPDCQRQGVGVNLLRFVENALWVNGQRLLLIETSELPYFEQARTFYAKCGYEKEARIRDYYADGDDMITFWKKLSAA